jgi:PAS domain S-box-containing protein
MSKESESQELMKLSSPHLMLLVLILVQLVLLVLICLLKELGNQIVALLCAVSFLSTVAIAWLLGRLIFSLYLEPAWLAKSKLLSALPEPGSLRAAGSTNEDDSLVSRVEVVVKELEASRQRERLIADFSSELLCCLNEERKFLELNVQTELVLGHSMMSLLGNTLDCLVLEEDLPSLIAYFDDCKEGANQNHLLEFRVRGDSGRLVDLEWQSEWSNSLQCFFCLARDISDRKQNQRLKQEISAMVTHDLRAPVTGLSFLFQNLDLGIFGELPEKARNEIRLAQDSADKIIQLINQLLDAEKLEGGKMETDMKLVRLADVYDYTKSMVSRIAERKNVEIKFPVSQKMVFADFEKTNQVLCNLLTNSIKWSPENSVIEVSEEQSVRSVIISVIDSGPGISESRQKVIFERFKSIEQPGSNTMVAGSGLGLYIARKLCELQDGSIGVKSQVGKGSKFWFSLRLGQLSQSIGMSLPDQQ